MGVWPRTGPAKNRVLVLVEYVIAATAALPDSDFPSES